ncbi:MAG: glucosidase family protein, partial [Armatimonadota bacterium]
WNANQYADTAQSIRKAINAKFGSSWGYAGWLDSEHNQHRHINHNSVLPLQYGISTDHIAEKVLKSIFSSQSMTKWGPLHMDSINGIAGSQLVWAFQRWNLVHALFKIGRADQALDLMVKWIDQESSFDILYGAPEAFHPDGKVTTLGYSWTAGRAVRAYLFGLFGLQLLPDGFAMHPKMPSAWSNMSLHKLEIRGTLFDIDVRRSDSPGMTVDGQEILGSNISGDWFDGKHHEVVIEYNE